MSAVVAAGASFTARAPSVLFEASPQWEVGNLNGVYFDVHPDDQRFLIASRDIVGTGEEDGPTPPAVVLVNNFFEELRARVPE